MHWDENVLVSCMTEYPTAPELLMDLLQGCASKNVSAAEVRIGQVMVSISCRGQVTDFFPMGTALSEHENNRQGSELWKKTVYRKILRGANQFKR